MRAGTALAVVAAGACATPPARPVAPPAAAGAPATMPATAPAGARAIAELLPVPHRNFPFPALVEEEELVARFVHETLRGEITVDGVTLATDRLAEATHATRVAGGW